MPYSPLISKIKVHNPNKKGSSSANRNYAIYIATREGVSLETIKNVNDLLKTDGIMEKDLREGFIHEEAGNKEYVEYMARRPRSHGLFGNVDTSDLKAVSSEIASLTASGRIIYRGIISLSEKDAAELGFRNIDAWNNYLRRVMPDVAQKLGVSSYDHTWVAAFHAEEKHPHVHYMLWDNQDRVKSPYIHKTAQQAIRIYLENEMFDNEYERAIKQVRVEEYDETNKIRNSQRKQILKETEIMMKKVGFTPGVEYEKLPTRASNDYLERIAVETGKLIEQLPGKGSFKYGYQTPEVKEQLNKIVDLMLEKKDLRNTFDEYLEGVRTSQQLKGRTKTKTDYEVNKEEKAIRRRIANQILHEIKPVILVNEEPSKKMTKNELEKTELSSTSQIEKELSKEWQEMWERRTLYEPSSQKTDAGQTADYEIENGTEFRSVEKSLSAAEQKYFIEWNEQYGKAMDLLYGEEPSIQTAFEIIESQAISGNALAIFEAGKLVDRQMVENVEQQEANEYFDEARAAFEKIYFSTEDDYKRQYAAYRLGKFYMSAIGSIEEADYKEAARWFGRAQGNKYAQYSLGKLYLEDRIYVSEKKDSLENKKAALKLFKNSAEGKNLNPFAAYELGKMFSQGIGTDINAEQGQIYFKNAFERFLKMSEKSTDDTLFYRLGRMYLNGLGTDVNEKEGEKYIFKASELGNESAKLSLATIYLKKDDHTLKRQAMQLLKEMADGDSNHSMAQYKLGAIYANPEQPVYNMEKAIGYFEKSAEQGNQFAQCRLGCLYYFGKDVPKNEELGKYWLQKSAEQGNQFAKDVLEGPLVGINFSYCLIKGVLTSLESLNRQINYCNGEFIRTQSKQAVREKYMHRDNQQRAGAENM